MDKKKIWNNSFMDGENEEVAQEDEFSSYAAEDAMRSSKTTGAEIAESPVDQLKSVAKADIIMQLSWPYFERYGRQRAMDTRRFANELSKYLNNAPFNIVSKVTTRGLGEATIFLGSK